MHAALRILREPLLHFVLAGAAIFGLYELTGNLSILEDDSRERIVITSAQIENLAALFARTWQRPPTRAELERLVQDHILEEVLVREALKLRLDQNDAVVRRRLRQKMDFISSDLIELPQATDEELQAFFDEHKSRFSYEPKLSFEHVYFNADRRGDAVAADARQLLSELAGASASTNVADLGDPSLLPRSFLLATPTDIAQQLGAEFAKQISEVDPGRWAGPFESAFGVHLVRISERVEGYVPELSEVREDVAIEWEFRRSRESQDEFNQLLRDRYDVITEWPVDEADRTSAEAAQ